MSGEEFFDGEIIVNGKIAVMEQEKVFDQIDLTFADYLAKKKEEIDHKIALLEEQMGLPEVYENEKKYDRVLQEHERLCSRTTESRELEKQKDILYSLGYHHSILNKPISKLSGGQRTALRLTECLSKEADVLLLDEPTNHLDFESIAWLERKIKKSEQTIVVISHDRFFLDTFVNVVVEIESLGFEKYNANYSSYLVQRVAHREVMQKRHDATQAKKEKMLASAKEKREWAKKHGNQGMRIMADRLERQATELPDIPNPKELEQRYKFGCISGETTGKSVFEAKNLKKSYDKVIFDHANISISRGDKIAIIGENGCGKTTLLKVLTNQIEADSGTLDSGSKLKIGYFDQEGENLPVEKKVIEYFLTVNDRMADHQIRNLAKKFGLSHDLPKKKIKSLSGGEKSRLQLMAILSGGYNVLVLDEPTNHLDLELREALEEALRTFNGTVIFVSHDRFFINKIARSLIKIDKGTIQELPGNYSANI
jgi:ATP-binding cassette subfamily F protein 3